MDFLKFKEKKGLGLDKINTSKLSHLLCFSYIVSMCVLDFMIKNNYFSKQKKTKNIIL